MSAVEARLAELGLELPEAFPAQGTYVSVRVDGDVAYVSGHGPMLGGKAAYQGKLGADLTIEEGQRSAELTMLNILASLKAELGDLDRVTGFLKLLILVNADPAFDRPHLVANGASDLVVALYGPGALHARSAIGAAALPFQIATEIEAIVKVESSVNAQSTEKVQP